MGTYQITCGETIRSILDAGLAAGYRHIGEKKMFTKNDIVILNKLIIISIIIITRKYST